jgi:hypothetical protein
MDGFSLGIVSQHSLTKEKLTQQNPTGIHMATKVL